MKRIILLLIIFITLPVMAQDPGIFPVEKGKAAPYTGMLVEESRFIELLDFEIKVETLEGQLKIQKGLIRDLKLLYNKELEEIIKPEKWYQTMAFNRWFGFTLGVVFTGAAIWGGVEIVKAVNEK